MKRIALALLAALLPFAALAADQSFAPSGNTAPISVTNASSTAIQVQGTPANATQRMITNVGPNTAFVAWCSTSTCTAVAPSGSTPANGFPVPAGAIVVLSFPPNAWFATITTGTGTATLYITPGAGN